MRASDICARFGGDEFLIFAAGCDLDAATEIARRILNKVEGKRQTLERAGFGVSIGIDIAPLATQHSSRRADQGAVQAKGAGRNRYVLSDVAQALQPDLAVLLLNVPPLAAQREESCAGLGKRLVPAVVDADLALDAEAVIPRSAPVLRATALTRSEM